MAKRILIDPVTRIEGHAKISIFLDDAGNVSDAEFAERRKSFKTRETQFGSGALWKYAQQVGNARDGALTHPGASAEKECYADS